jgi:hypothetical protein
VHLEVEPDLDDWKVWALSSGIDTRIVSFLNYRPGLLFAFDANSSEQAFASPRTWEYASKLLQSGLAGEELRVALAGTVGEGPCMELWAFLEQLRELPSVDEILAGQDLVPDNPSVLYALCGTLAQRAGVHLDRVLAYALALPAEFSVLLVKDTHRLHGERVFASPGWSAWSAAYEDVLL